MRIAVKKITEWIHASLILAMIFPLLYCFGAKQPDMIGRNLYLKCLIIIFPVIATDYVIDLCRGLLTYLISCALISAATAGLGWVIAGSLHQNFLIWVYLVILILESVFLMISRMTERLQRKSIEDDPSQSDPTRRPYIDSLRTPSFAVLIYFIAVYALAVNLNNPAVCNAALFSAAIYTVITVLHQYICETEYYLSLNKRTCNIPSKRIYGIGTGMVAIFLLLFIIVILPAFFTISNRLYRDIRESTTLLKIDYSELIRESELEYEAQEPLMEMLIAQNGEPEPTPEWLITLFKILETVVFTFLAALLLKAVYDTFRAFRGTADENGDIVEELEETNEGVKIKRLRISRRKLTERERIRKEYRKFIRRYRKERPARYESPTEIEMNAGIAEDKECKEIHRHYELARYRPES